MLGSGSMGEFTAIDQVEVIAGASILLGACIVGLVLMRRGSSNSDVILTGRVLATLSLFATCLYSVGLACVALGWMTPSLFPDRFKENLAGSLIAAALGLIITQLPKLMDRIIARHDQPPRGPDPAG